MRDVTSKSASRYDLTSLIFYSHKLFFEFFNFHFIFSNVQRSVLWKASIRLSSLCARIIVQIDLLRHLTLHFIHVLTNIVIYAYIHTYIYVCVCVREYTWLAAEE